MLLAVALIAAAVFVGAMRLLLPFAADYRADVEQWVSDYLQVQVQIEKLDLQWRGFAPSLKLVNIGLIGAESGEEELRLAEAYIDLDLAGVIRHHRFQIRRISLEGLSLEIHRDLQGNLSLAGLDAEGASDGRQYLKWLQQVRGLQLLDSQLHFYDELNDQSYRFDDVDIQVRNEGERHRLWAKVDLPFRFGKTLEFGLDFEGPAHHPELWQGLSYFKARRLRLHNWLEYWPESPFQIESGWFEFELWSRWDRGQLTSLSAKTALAELSVASRSEPSELQTLKKFSANWHWQPEKLGWRLDVNQLKFQSTAEPWPLGGFSFSSNARGLTKATELVFSADYLRLHELLPLLKMIPSRSFESEVRHLLLNVQRLNPHGEVQDLQLQYRPDQTGLQGLDLHAKFNQLGWQGYEALPSVQGLHGAVEVDAKLATLLLDSQKVRFELPSLFRQPLHLNQLQGAFQLSQNGAEWQLHSPKLQLAAESLAIVSRVELRFKPQQAPFLDLRGHFLRGDLSALSDYLPVGIMSSNLVNWLDNSIKSGELSSGELLVYGQADQFPFRDHEGVFDIGLDLDKVSLQYDPRWPEIEQLKAKLHFFGPRLDIHAAAANSRGIALSDSQITFEDLQQAQLRVDANLSGKLQTMLDFVRHSPLKTSVGNFLLDLQAKGEATLGLQLDIPLAATQRTKVSGVLNLNQNRLSSKQLNVRLSRCDGAISFSEKAFVIKKVRARLNGRQLRIKTALLKDKNQSVTRLSFRTQQKAATLSKQYNVALGNYLHGRSLWQLDLDIPHSDFGSPLLRLSSTLKGTEVSLPEPFTKSQQEVKRLLLETRLASGLGVQTLRFQYGKAVRGLFQFEHQRKAVKLVRGELRFHDGEAELPVAQGIRLAGTLPELPLDRWLAVIQNQTDSGGGEGAEDLLAAVDLKVKQATLFGKPLFPVALQLERQPNNWIARLNSDGVRGRMILSRKDFINQPLVINLSQLDLSAFQRAGLDEGAASSEEWLINPRLLPPLKVSIEELRWGEQRLRQVQLQTRREVDGLSIRRLGFTNPNLEMLAQGYWRSEQSADRRAVVAQQSRLKLTISSDDLGAGFRDLGYVDAIHEGHGTLKANLSWPGSPFQPQAATLKGNLSMLFKEGQLSSLNPGVGRIFGLLSLQALPRRLSLDFKDFFSKGFGFDLIKGRFSFADGQAYTSNMMMKGPIGHVLVKGRTGLVAQDYDQVITINPNLAGSLPLVGLLAGGTGVGLAVLALEGILKSMGAKVEELGQLKYTLSGSWANPALVLVAGESFEDANDDEL
ncbi:MAG: YhdP family protein [Gammaproteobacteria bacterium]|nr:YhdP family protein [Gammaproteobacteria bacterium]